MHTKKLNNSYFALILLLAALLLLSIPIVRVTYNSPAIPGSVHYEALNEGSVLLDVLLSFIPHIILSVSLPLILALGSLILFAMILLRYTKEQQPIYYALCILILTPTFITIHLGLVNYQFILFFTLLFTYFYIRNTKFFYLPLALLFLFNPLYTLFIALGISIKSFVDKKETDTIVQGLFFLGLCVLSFFIPREVFTLDVFVFSANSLFSFFNATYGYSLFLLVLGFGGIFFEKKRALPLIIFFVSIFYEPLRIIGIVLLSYYAGLSFYKLQQRKWTISFIGTLTLVLFVSILVFSTTTYLKEQIQDTPNEHHVDGLFFLDEVVTGARVLSSSELSSFITFITGADVVSSPNYYYSQNYAFIAKEFSARDIGYIFIDSEMRNGGIWEHDEQGLLFLLRYNDNFRKIYENEEIEIYLYTRWRE